MKFILDIDGVMVHANPHRKVEIDTDGFYKFNRVAVDALNAVINKDGDDELILSTSHRFRFSISQWLEIFRSRGIFTNHISIIDLPVQLKQTRKTEIITWITTHHFKSEEIIIIDDDKSLNELPANLKERLVLTNSYIGLNSSDDIKKIIRRKKIGSVRKRKTPSNNI
jgi:hypothetical protein